jgi:hypothetical protein
MKQRSVMSVVATVAAALAFSTFPASNQALAAEVKLLCARHCPAAEDSTTSPIREFTFNPRSG